MTCDLSFERERNLLLLFRTDRDLLLLLAVLLVPRHEGVGARREVGDGERAVRLRRRSGTGAA